MTLYLNGTTGISGVDGSAGSPAVQGTDTNTGISFPAADTIAFNEGGAEVGRFDSSGRLLVGTSSSPSSGDGQYARLVVQGNTVASSAYVAFARNAAATSITSGQDIALLNFTDNAGNTFSRIECYADANAGTNDYPGRLVFSTTADGASSPTERMRITNEGRVFTGTTTGLSAGGVSGTHSVQTTTAGQWITLYNHTTSGANPYGLAITYSATAPNNGGQSFLWCEDNAAVRARINSNGGISNYSANNVNLSDINAKKDISPLADTWDCIKEWEIVNYRYKDQPDDADLNLGVIAQQVAESCPEVITVFQEAKEASETEPAQEERLGVKEQQMYWMAIKALQEAQVRIEQLEQRLTDAGIA